MSHCRMNAFAGIFVESSVEFETANQCNATEYCVAVAAPPESSVDI
jgi:hypothetical protein